MNIDRKIRVFLSSKCGGEYTVVRKALERNNYIYYRKYVYQDEVKKKVY